jgi:hypothetical protein
MAKRGEAGIWRTFWVILILAVLPLAGCSSSGEDDPDTGSVGFCNFTADAYDLELRRVSGNEVIRTLTLGPGSGGDPVCAEETEVTVGTHYVAAFQQGGDFFSESREFLVLHEGTRPTVYVTGGGELGVDGGDTAGEGNIEVCNTGPRDYLVTLRREVDDAEVARFELESFFEFNDVCDEFLVIPSGVYYLKVFEADDIDDQSTSPIFFLTDGETEEFRIEPDGDVVNVD